ERTKDPITGLVNVRPMTDEEIRRQWVEMSPENYNCNATHVRKAWAFPLTFKGKRGTKMQAQLPSPTGACVQVVGRKLAYHCIDKRPLELPGKGGVLMTEIGVVPASAHLCLNWRPHWSFNAYSSPIGFIPGRSCEAIKKLSKDAGDEKQL